MNSGASKSDTKTPDSAPIEIGEGVWRIQNQGLGANTYVCRLEDGESCLVVDPGLDARAVRFGLDALGLKPVSIFCTHGHFDHVASATMIRQEFGAPVHLHEADVDLLRSANFHMMLARIPDRISTPKVDNVASNGSRYLTGDDQVEFIHTPGHTEGSCCLRFGKYVFTGDTLYRDVLGIASFPGEDLMALRTSLAALLEGLPPSSVICPGHGGAGPLESIKANNVELIKFLQVSTPK